MNPTQSNDMKVARHFTILVYPFRHALSDQTRLARLQTLEGRWRPWWSRLQGDGQSLAVALDDSYFFLPYVRILLFPETSRLPEADPPQQVEQASALAGLSLQELAQRVPPHAVLRLTYDPQDLESLHSLQLDLPRDKFSAPFKLSWVDVALFPQQIGFLLAKVELEEIQPTVSRLNEFLYYLRRVHAPKVGWELASWQCRGAEAPLTFKSRDFVDSLLQGLTDVSRTPPQKLDAYLAHAVEIGPESRYSATPYGQVYGEVFHLYSYACLAGSSVPVEASNPEGVIAGSSTPATTADADGAARFFASPVQRVLYELSTCTDTRDPNYVPHPNQLESLWKQNLVALWENWQGMALRDHVLFLGTRDSGFPVTALPHNVESDYFHLYLFTLFQKTWLSMKAEGVVHADLSKDIGAVRRLFDDFMIFQNRYWFTEVTRKPLSTELYRRFRQGLDVVPLYDGLTAQVRELQEYFESKNERVIAEGVANNLNAITRVQEIVHLIEYLLASVYLGHLWHMIFHHNEGFSEWREDRAILRWISDAWFVHGGVFLAAGLGAAGVWLLNRFLARRHKSEGDAPETSD